LGRNFFFFSFLDYAETGLKVQVNFSPLSLSFPRAFACTVSFLSNRRAIFLYRHNSDAPFYGHAVPSPFPSPPLSSPPLCRRSLLFFLAVTRSWFRQGEQNFSFRSRHKFSYLPPSSSCVLLLFPARLPDSPIGMDLKFPLSFLVLGVAPGASFSAFLLLCGAVPHFFLFPFFFLCCCLNFIIVARREH